MLIEMFLIMVVLSITFVSIDWTPEQRKPPVTLDLTSLNKKKP